MKRATIIGAGIVIVVVGAFLILFFFGKKNGTSLPPLSSGGSLPVASSTGAKPFIHPTSTTFQIGTPQGSVTVDNFLNNPPQVSADQTAVTLVETSTYDIVYYTNGSSFNIGIIAPPVAQSIIDAQNELLKILGISQADACKLNVVVGAPASLDPNYAGKNLGLTFCK